MKNSVRIISGDYKGREIMTPGGATHPMGERERIALFNMILLYIPGARVLDAYAGSGALGIEALSRGASECVFLEKNVQAAKVISSNLRELGISERTTIERGNTANFASTEPFDVIFADPPYDDLKLDEVSHLADFLVDGGIMILSHPAEIPEIKGLTLIKTRQYARAHLSVFTK